MTFAKYLDMLEYVCKITYLHWPWLEVMTYMWHYTAAKNCRGCYGHNSSANLHNWSMLYLRESHLRDDGLSADLCVGETGQHVHWILVLVDSEIPAGDALAHSATAGWQRGE
jgi:hypothetical protein